MCTMKQCTHFDCLSTYLYICYHNAVICAIQISWEVLTPCLHIAVY
uniref:Uncharacterized protein n=1 Tax=Siphoviridae sp. ctv2R2 TaxID=2823609 RepID=A0A8S5LAJ5_9CAUD|nr:MAG TPA: hypothetical protein [Siphoviridae sp. ctv2R2]